jgi:hypothetical protein
MERWIPLIVAQRGIAGNLLLQCRAPIQTLRPCGQKPAAFKPVQPLENTAAAIIGRHTKKQHEKIAATRKETKIW